VEKMLELVAMPLAHPEVYLHTGVQPPRGVLLHGLPGCSKMMLANAIGGVGPLPPPSFFFRMGCRLKKVVLGRNWFIAVSVPSIVLGMSGESEKMLHKTFDEAKVRTSHPCGEPNHLNATTWLSCRE
jgi:ribosome biogenesis ATPase